MPAFDDVRAKQPFVVQIEEECDDSGGSGYDSGSLKPMEPEECPSCHGSGKQMVVRNYLAEALRIAAGSSSRAIEREHSAAVIEDCRALMAITEVR